MTKRRAPWITAAEEASIQARIAADPDDSDVTPDEAVQARPASEVLATELFAALTRRGRPRSEASKVLVTLRLPPAVLDGYRSGGPGWQVRMGEVLSAGLAHAGEQARARAAAEPAKALPGCDPMADITGKKPVG